MAAWSPVPTPRVHDLISESTPPADEPRAAPEADGPRLRLPAMTDLFDAIPKVELHCHVEGTVRPATVIELARKAGRPLPVEDPEQLYRYTSLDTFLAIFWLVQETLTEPADWERIAYESLVDAVPHGLRYRETFFTPARHLAAGQDLAGIVDGLSAGIAAAEADTGVRAALIADMDRAYGPGAAVELVDQLVTLRRAGRAERVIGVGMDSTELGVDLASFKPAFDLARGAGFRLTGHAGEAVGTGPQNIRVALDVLGVERVDHGVAVVEDAELVRRMAAERIPLTVCPNSNIVIANRFPNLEAHPFRAMREAGLVATINTDDPGMTDLDLGVEYRTVAAAQRLTFDEVAAVALDGVEACWLAASEKASLRTEFETRLAELRPAAA
jgi:adenosine deaminase